jgi:hypothetical protein
MTTGVTSDPLIIANTQEWLEKAVIGLHLCPFAKAVHLAKQIRYIASHALTSEELLTELMTEMKFLASADPTRVDTTLLIHPFVLNDFLDYNEFIDVADAALADLNLEGILQVATFHPDYQFAGTEPTDITNFTNRSPYPTLHLLREHSVELAIESYPDTNEIPAKNIQTMQQLGLQGWKTLGLKKETSKK